LAHYNLALVFQKEGQKGEAAEELKMTLKIDPHYSCAHGIGYSRNLLALIRPFHKAVVSFNGLFGSILCPWFAACRTFSDVSCPEQRYHI
jgi:hypothetical protein